MNTASTITLRAPKELRPHALNKRMPRWDRESDEWLAFVQDIQDRGIQVPLRITEKGEVVDGETRRQAAAALNLESVPCVVVPSDDVAATLLQEIQLRRNLTKGQRAYLLVPLIEATVAGHERRLSNLRRGANAAESASPARSAGDYALSLGFSRDLLDQARRLHAAFEGDAELREQFEPQILDFDSPIGLGACLAGIAGQKATKDTERKTGAQLDLFTDAWGTLGKRFSYWTKLDDDDRRKAVPVLRQTIKDMPADLRAELKKALAAADRDDVR